MPWHESWRAMQGLTRRTWLSFAEFAALVRERTGDLTDTQIRRAIRQAERRPEKRYGTYRYQRHHVRAVRAAAERNGWIMEECHGLADGRVPGRAGSAGREHGDA